MSALRSGNHRRYEEDEENAGADQIASIVRVLVSVQPTHGHRAAARFPKRRGKDFDDPEAERHFGDLAQESIVVLHLSLASRLSVGESQGYGACAANEYDQVGGRRESSDPCSGVRIKPPGLRLGT